MAIVHFYEKPGCLNNARQKRLLSEAGHTLIVHDLLQQPWSNDRARLRSFFGDMPVREWFNRSAPAIKNGDVEPDIVNERQAIELMVADPLLIRRPLLEIDGRRRAGFDVDAVSAWLDLSAESPSQDLEACPRQDRHRACQP